MALLMRKLRPSVPSISDEDDDNSIEYSFAMEYIGPPVTYSIPQAVPFKIDQVPVASVAASASLLDNSSVPVIQPIIKTSHTNPESLKSHSLPNESVSGMGSSGWLGCADAEKFETELSRRTKSSGALRLSNSGANLEEQSAKPGLLEIADDNMEGERFHDDVINKSLELTESGLSSPTLSSEIFSGVEDDCNNETTPKHVKKPSVVTFRDPESNEVVVIQEEFDHSEAGRSIPVRQTVEQDVKKKVSCYRCHKGNRFTEKEICITCGAKYCCNCVLRAMGSMPEGRKCITCIGYRIDESRRKTVGKCSRMLKRMLTELEVKEIMNFEMTCEANQMPGELVFVNGEPLTQEKLMLLQSCPHPPKKLKPGYYWYDNVSGFWGKEGEKPSEIISPHLDIGGRIRENASNGNTNVLINNREITKAELWMLRLAGVTCEGRPHFWVSADGSCQEEGQNNIRGRIWDRNKTKLFCMMLSLPVPSGSMDPSEEEVHRVITDNREQKMFHKLLLVGYNESGTSTIYKQAKLLYNVPFSENEHQSIKLVIQSNLYTYLGILLEGREIFEEEILIEKRKRMLIDESTSLAVNTGEMTDNTPYSIGPKLKSFSDWLLRAMVSCNLDAIFPASAREYAPLVEDLWKDAAIQATYSRRNEIKMLPRGASYFLDRAIEISRVDYQPSDTDILYAEGINTSNSLTSMEFSFPKSAHEDLLDSEYQHDPSIRYQLIRVHPRSLGENCKWLEMFEDVDIILFCVALSDYDENSVDIDGVSTNKMLASKQLFENIVTHPTFENKKFLLILNKYDLFEEKIEQAPLRSCEWFHDFNPVISHNHNRGNNIGNNPSLAQRAFLYIAMKFKILFRSITDRKLFVSMVTGLEPDTVDKSLRYAREVVMWEKEDSSFINDEMSSASIETSSS
ncbi:Extra-large guanine nucleotide-binding protein like [Quillaja saponaria]|uniref:Extra-large guanine nucleotide-binding protein like n=1 Tax=Quillaja saponaria TaxID=32244 RepID=A0AAD7KTZ0_QUISA|nr:Extra-large guanine nucleotide-binding protein like [Quillaja saponaria]